MDNRQWARERRALCVSAGNYKFFEMGRVLPFKVFSIANIGPSAIKVVTTALEAQTRKFSKAGRSTRDLLANYLPAFTKLNKRYPVLFAFASNLPRLWRSYPIILDRLDQHLEEISLLPRRISFIIEFERSKLRFFFFFLCRVRQSWGEASSRTRRGVHVAWARNQRCNSRPDDPVARTVSNKCAVGREHGRNRAIRSHGNFNYQFSIR